jgi:sec-independent protein translocase protein TatA
MVSTFGFFSLSTPSLIIILAVIVLLFGAKLLPKLSRSIGSSATELRKGLKGDDEKPTNPQA